MMNDLDFLKGLTRAFSSSGKEKAVFDFLEESFAALSYRSERNGLGDLIVKNYRDGECDLMFDAHADQVGFVVTEVLEGGFLKIAPVGSPDGRCLEAVPVIIDGKEPLRGVITSTPMHLDDRKELKSAEEVFVDTGLSDAKDLVSVSDRVHYAADVTPLLGDRVASSGLDNKISMLALYKTACRLSGSDKRIAFVFPSREEVGLSGASAAAESVKPRRAVVVDVSFGFTGKENRHECGIIGKGPMIGFSPVLSDRLSKMAVELCEKHNIPYQREVMNGRTGTDADAVSVSGTGVETVTVSIPIYGMHTAGEVVSFSDVEKTAELLSILVTEG